MLKTQKIENVNFIFTETRRAHSAGPNKGERASWLVETGKGKNGNPKTVQKDQTSIEKQAKTYRHLEQNPSENKQRLLENPSKIC